MKRVLLVALIALFAITGCKSEPPLQEKINLYIQKYLYAVRDAVDGKKGTVEDVYKNFISSKMKAVLTLEDYKEHVTKRYKGKIAAKLRTSYANIVIDKQSQELIEARGKTSNEGRMGKVMNADKSLIYHVRVVMENKGFRVEQDELMAKITEEKADAKRLADLLANYKGLIRLEDVVGKKVKGREGVAELMGTILNASADLDLIRVGVKVKFKDGNGDIIYATEFYPVIDMRFEGLRTSVLPSQAKVFRSKVPDIPEEWDPEQPLAFAFYLIDGKDITPADLSKELQERAKLKTLIEDTKKADEEARKQLKELWEREKALKAKIKEIQNTSKK